MVIPVAECGKKIRVLTNSGDVIHSFFIPSLGTQRYAIPGRTIEMWMEADKPGVYYGECNQDLRPGPQRKMPISVHAVTDAWTFKTWIEQDQEGRQCRYPPRPIPTNARVGERRADSGHKQAGRAEQTAPSKDADSARTVSG